MHVAQCAIAIAVKYRIKALAIAKTYNYTYPRGGVKSEVQILTIILFYGYLLVACVQRSAFRQRSAIFMSRSQVKFLITDKQILRFANNNRAVARNEFCLIAISDTPPILILNSYSVFLIRCSNPCARRTTRS